jgi:hypothetical protein
MRNKIIIQFVLAFFHFAGFAQQTFLDRGKIFYERRISQLALQDLLTERNEGFSSIFLEEMKKQFPKVISDQYILEFDPQQSYYHAGVENTNNKYLFTEFKPNETEFIHQQLEKNIAISKMNLFEKTYLTSDTLKKLNWKISGETREIAGFECKKAVTTIADSVVVVAFYTDEITPSTGPLGFNGLPGTILGFAIPRLYLTLFATRVERMDTPIKVGYKPTEKFTNKKTAVDDLKKVDMYRKWKEMMILNLELK